MKQNNSKTTLKLAFFLNLFFTVLEIVGGILTNSIAIISDSIHDLGDSLSIGLSWFFESKSKKKPNSKYTYGYARYSLLGGLISSVVLLVGAIFIISEAIPRIINPQPVNTLYMLLFAIFGVIVNGAAAFHASRGHSLNEKAVSLHLFEDVFGWVAVLIAAIVMQFWNVPILDSVLSIIFTVYILYHVFVNLKRIVEILLEKAPDNIKLEEIKEKLIDNEKIKNIHHVHIWSLEGNITVLTMHLVVADNVTAYEIDELKENVHAKLKELGINHSTLEVELESNFCENHNCKSYEDIAQVNSAHSHHHTHAHGKKHKDKKSKECHSEEHSHAHNEEHDHCHEGEKAHEHKDN